MFIGRFGLTLWRFRWVELWFQISYQYFDYELCEDLHKTPLWFAWGAEIEDIGGARAILKMTGNERLKGILLEVVNNQPEKENGKR